MVASSFCHDRKSALRPGETDQHCLPDTRQFQQPVLTCSFRHRQIFQTFHVRQAHFARRQAKMFLIQIKNIFACQQANVACSVLACQFHHADLATGVNWQTKVTKLQIVMLDKQCWPVSPGL